jgi:RNA polymerase sigma-70 factor, ECF subfamily
VNPSSVRAASHDESPTAGAGGEQRRALSTGPPRLTALRELQLIEAQRAGDPEALSELLQAYQRRIYSVCHRMLRNPDDAADMTQETLVRIIEALDTYDGRAKLSTWIIRVAMNCCLSHLRKARLRSAPGGPAGRQHPAQEPDLAPGREPSAGRRIEQQEASRMLEQALAALEPEARAILVLRDMAPGGPLEYEQIAEILDLPLGTVKSRLFRARAALRAILETMDR